MKGHKPRQEQQDIFNNWKEEHDNILKQCQCVG